jgi:hypothetical protein
MLSNDPPAKKPRLDTDLIEIGIKLEGAVKANNVEEVHTCLGLLEAVPMTLDLLQSSKIGRTVNESLKQCSDTSAVERARELLQEWKTIAKSPPVPVEESTAVDALASLLNSLPDLEALLSHEEEPQGRGIKWKSDNELVQMVEFGIMETCEDLRRRIDDTHGGLMALHPHGQDTVEQYSRFQESRRKERAMGGNRLKMHLSEDDLMDENEIFVTVEWFWPPKVKVLTPEAVFEAKKLRSYERQDLADMHGAKPEIFYSRDSHVPENPSEPSSVFKLQQNTTVDILLGTGVDEPIDLDLAGPAAEATPAPTTTQSTASFDDEFVKLDSKIQTFILGSETLLNLFTKDPILLREVTLEKLESILNQFRKPSSMPHTVDDRKGWGAATIRSAVRKEVMTNFVPPPPPYRPDFHENQYHGYMPPNVALNPGSQHQQMQAYQGYSSGASTPNNMRPPMHSHPGMNNLPPPPPPPVHGHPGMIPPPPMPHPGMMPPPMPRGNPYFPSPQDYGYRGPPRRSPPSR